MNQRILLIIILLIIPNISSLGQIIFKDPIILFVFKDKHNVNLYYTPEMDSIKGKIRDDGANGLMYGLNVIEKRDSMIKVVAWNTFNHKKITGWIHITEASIIGRSIQCIYEVYDNPSFNSRKYVLTDDWDKDIQVNGKIITVRGNIDSNFKVVDIQGKWLKVIIHGKDHLYVKWLPEKYQCHVITGACN